jgi:NAD(P)H-hydrate repair Nnr-like enzyme with NAD(P)H-hydrate dehydratase domain
LPIGIPNAAWVVVKNNGQVGKTVTLPEIIDNLPKRDAASHKGKHGKLLCVCGSTAFRGAAALAALSAFRTGIGSVKVAALPDVIPIVAAAVLEATYLKMQQIPTVISVLTTSTAFWMLRRILPHC